MFHVERFKQNAAIRGITAVLLSIVMSSCNVSRQVIQIPDYILIPNGKEIVGAKDLTAFVFENNQTKLPIEQFLSQKFKTDNYMQNEYWVTIDKDKYKIIIYDNTEFEKYFNSANYAVINQVPDIDKKGDSRKFIAISMINAYNEDCLKDGSLFQYTAVKYLKNLKEEFYNQR